MAIVDLLTHEPASGGEVGAVGELVAGGVVGVEDETIDVEGEDGVRFEDDVALKLQGNISFTNDDGATLLGEPQTVGDDLRGHGLRVVALKAEQHGAVRHVAASSRAQTSAQSRSDPEHGQSSQAVSEQRGGAHGSDGVRRRRPDANLEHVRYTRGGRQLNGGGHTVTVPARLTLWAVSDA